MNWKRMAIIIASLLALVHSPGAQVPPCDNILYGFVTDEESGEPMPFVTILVRETGKGAVTDSLGYYRIEGLCDSVYTLMCSHVGWSHTIEEVAVKNSTEKNFRLHHETYDLTEFTVSAPAPVLRPVQPVQEISGSRLESLQGQTLGDVVSSLPGVTTLNTGSSISKPVIRGLHSNRVVVINNGVRQEGNQWGIEHAPEIDPFLAGKVKAVNGAAGVEYGPEAVGGVILVEPEKMRAAPGIGGSVYLSGFSNGLSWATSAMVEGTLRRIPLSGRLQGTWKKGGNKRAPDYILANTGEEELNFSWTAAWDEKNWRAEAFYSQFNSDLGIFAGSHIGNLTDLQRAIEAEKPLVIEDFTYEIGRPFQKIEHEVTKFKVKANTGKIGETSIQVARQFNRRREYDAHSPRGTGNPSGAPGMEFELTTYTGDAIWQHKPFLHLSGKMGVQALIQENTTDRGGLIPDYSSTTVGVFWLEHWRRYPVSWEFEAGARYDRKTLSVDEDSSVESESFDFGNFTGTLGIIKHLRGQWRLNLLLSSAWRAPNVNELFSDGVHHGAASFEKGDKNLRSEKALQANFSVENGDDSRVKTRVNFYYQHIDDFIYLQPQGEFVLTIRGAFPAFHYRQAEAALYGAEGSIDWNFYKNFHFEGNFSLLRARNLSEKSWLPLMPADRFYSAIRYNFKNNGTLVEPFISLGAQQVLRQTRYEEESDFTSPPPAYTLLDFEAGCFWKKMSIGLKIANLMNVSYRSYMNRFRYFSDETGRNISVRLKYSF